VFCGLGEPTLRLNVVLSVAAYLKSRDVHVRVNTNGQGSAYAGHDITPVMRGLVDTVSVSMNASNAEDYQRDCESEFGKEAYSHMLDFTRNCLAQGMETILTVVDVIGDKEIGECRHVAEELGAVFRVRHYIQHDM
jgi:TatD family-associated radical SAM protein